MTPRSSQSSPRVSTSLDGYPPGGTPLADRLADLKARVAAATEAEAAARRALSREQYTAAREVTKDLLAFRDANDFQKPDATPIQDRPAREKELTDQALDAIRERGLTFSVLGNGGGVEIVDPRVCEA